MLTTYLNTLPFTKFILIEDSVQGNGKQFLANLVKSHLKRNIFTVHYFIFQEHFNKTKAQYVSNENIILYNYTTNIENWNWDKNINEFERDLSNIKSNNSVIVIDSLANFIYMYELSHTYRILNNLTKNNACISQVISILHSDLLEDSASVIKNFEHLSTLSIKIEEKSNFSEKNRLSFVYKKVGGKVIKQIEEYSFQEDKLITNPVSKPDPAKFVQETVINSILPENLSTFKISLSDKDKESREQTTLPYLPKKPDDTGEGEGKVFYKFDDIDDWDEEDPDDDLDI